jgi:predicted nucleic acid-binding protein
MQKLVIDSSVMVKWLNQQDEERLVQADKIMRDVQNKAMVLLAPELAKYEVANVLLLRKRLPVATAQVTLDVLFSLPIVFVAQSSELARRTYEIALEAAITYYDASFVALAQQEAATLVTDNFKHQGKATDVKVIALQDYS